MGRRFERSYIRFPIDLVSTVPARKFAAASILNVSQGGLRIQTGPSLVAGQLLNVSREGQGNPIDYCRVVWSHTHGGALPSAAGLEFLEMPPDPTFPGLGTAASHQGSSTV
jgi:PilZ domain